MDVLQSVPMGTHDGADGSGNFCLARWLHFQESMGFMSVATDVALRAF